MLRSIYGLLLAVSAYNISTYDFNDHSIDDMLDKCAPTGEWRITTNSSTKAWTWVPIQRQTKHKKLTYHAAPFNQSMPATYKVYRFVSSGQPPSGSVPSAKGQGKLPYNGYYNYNNYPQGYQQGYPVNGYYNNYNGYYNGNYNGYRYGQYQQQPTGSANGKDNSQYAQYYNQMLQCQTATAKQLISHLKYLQQQLKNIHHDMDRLLYDTYYYGPNFLEILGTSIRTVENSIYFTHDLYTMLTSTNIYCLVNGPWSQATIDTLLDIRYDARVILDGTSGLTRIPMNSQYPNVLGQFMHAIYKIVSQFVDTIGNRVDSLAPAQPTTSSDNDPFAEVSGFATS